MEKITEPSESKNNRFNNVTDMHFDDLMSYNPNTCQEDFHITLDELQDYFEKHDTLVPPPLSVKRDNETTLFVSSGVQALDDCIHKEMELPNQRIFVAQPVLRSQFLGSKDIASHTSFYNLSLLETNCSFEQHMGNLNEFLDLLVKKGLDRQNFSFVEKEDSPKWGKRKFDNQIIKIHYNDLEVGDAVYIPSMPQDTRDSFSISDIGFGLERLNYNEKDTFSVSDDCLRTLALLEASNVQPSNKSHGYRYRLFSKKFVQLFDLNYTEMTKKLSFLQAEIDYWSPAVNTEKANLDNVVKECERNFNREIMNYLSEEFGVHNEIPINQTVHDFLQQLRQINVLSAQDYNKLLTRIQL